MLAHVRTIAWLQLRLVKNSILHNFRWLGAIAWTLQIVGGAIFSTVLTGVAFGKGLSAFTGDDGWRWIVIVDGVLAFLLSSQIFKIASTLESADFIDTSKLLFLPVRLRTLFAINLILRSTSGLVLFLVPPFLGLCTGLAVTHGPQMFLGIPLGIVTYLTIIVWFDCIRESMLTFSKKRMRVLVSIGCFTAMAVLGGPYFGYSYLNLLVSMENLEASQQQGEQQEDWYERKFEAERAGTEFLEPEIPDFDEDMESEIEQRFRAVLFSVNRWIPLGWLPLGLHELTQRKFGVALSGGLGLMILASLGLTLDYRIVVNKYRGAGPPAHLDKPRQNRSSSRLTRLTLPRIGEAASAYAGLVLLTHLRTTTVRIAFRICGILAVAGMMVPLFLDVTEWRDHFWVDMAPLLIAAFATFVSPVSSINIFGQDRGGFQVIVLTPVKRHIFLLSKNIITSIFTLTWVALLMAPCVLIFRPHPAAIAAALLVTLQTQITLSLIGNL